MRLTNGEAYEQHKALVQMYSDQEQFYVPEIMDYVIRLRPEMIKIGSGSRIDSFVKLEGGEGLTIGRHVHIASYAHLNIGGGTCSVGDYCAIASGGKLISGGNKIEGKSMSAVAPKELQVIRRSFVVMEPYSVVLTNATVLNDVVLHEGAVLAAGSVAHCDIPAWEIWAGTPARFVKMREVVK